GQRLEPVGGEDGERRIRHGGTTFDVSERVRERRAGGSAGATTPLAATHRDGHGAHRTRTPRQLTDWPHLQWNGRHAANLAPRGPSRRLPGALGSSSVRPPDSYSRRSALLVNKPSLRHKWTSAALVGGLLVSAVAAAPAWAQRSRDDVEDEIQSVDEDLNTTIEEYNALAEEIADNEEMIAEVQADFEESEAALIDLQDRLAGFITETYVDQGVGDLALILESGSPQAFVERLDRLNSANMYDFDLMTELNTLTEEHTAQLELLTDLQADQEADQAELEQMIDEIETRMDDL